MLFVAIPCYDRKVHAETARALINEHGMAQGIGLEIRASFLPGSSLITQARNQIFAEFEKSDASKMICVDADVSWEPGTLLKLASHARDVVGGAYRYKEAKEGYPVQFGPGDLMATDGLLDVACVPGGFMAVTKRALERFRERHGDRYYTHHGERFYSYFVSDFHGGNLYGEDTAFCRDYRLTGDKVWLDPELTLTHHDGAQAFTGCIGAFLKAEHAKKKTEVPELKIVGAE